MRFKSVWIFRFCARAFCSAASFLAIVLGDRRLGAFALLQVIAQRGLFHRQGSLGLMHPLFIDAIVNLEQHLARLDNREIFDVDGGDIAVDLRANKVVCPRT